MGSDIRWVIPLDRAGVKQAHQVGGKAAKLGQLIQAGFRVPSGFCLPVSAYEQFVEEARLTNTIQMELGRKPLASMRWEES